MLTEPGWPPDTESRAIGFGTDGIPCVLEQAPDGWMGLRFVRYEHSRSTHPEAFRRAPDTESRVVRWMKC
jgi:hypothetical protein